MFKELFFNPSSGTIYLYLALKNIFKAEGYRY